MAEELVSMGSNPKGCRILCIKNIASTLKSDVFRTIYLVMLFDFETYCKANGK
jgi:hypothetical protein